GTGGRRNAAESEKRWEEMGAARSGMNADAARVPDAFAAWEGADAASWDARSTAEWIAAQRGSDLGKVAIDAQLVADNGVTTAWQSYLGNLAQVKGGGVEKYWTETEVFRCRG